MVRIFLLAGAAVAASGCQVWQTVEGSGRAKTESRAIGAFTKIELAAPADVHLTVGRPASLTITADDNLLPLITTAVKGDTLVIGTDKNYNSRSPVRIVASTDSLLAAAVTGSGNLTASGVKSPSFATSITGSGELRASGAADRVNASIAGSGSMDLVELDAIDARGSISGSGELRLSASRELDAVITGSGNIRYRGGATVKSSLTGSGGISRL